MTTIISCPSCGAAYDIPDAAALRGRKVRCQSCAAVWRVGATAEAPAREPSRRDTLSPETGKAEASSAVADAAGRSGNTGETPRTISLGRAAPPATAGPAATTGGRRVGRRQSGFDEVEAAIAALQSSIEEQSSQTASADPFAPAAKAGFPAVVRDQAIAARVPPAGRPANDLNGYRPLSDAGPLADDPFASDGDLDDELRTSRIAGGIAWVAFAAVLFGLGAFAWIDRVGVVRALPGAAAAYGLLGAPVNARGLEFSGVDAQWQIDGKGRPVLSLTGQVKNITREPQSVPTVVFAFLDEDGRELFDWATPVRINSLPAGETLPFTTVVPAPPEAVRNVEIRFAKAQR